MTFWDTLFGLLSLPVLGYFVYLAVHARHFVRLPEIKYTGTILPPLTVLVPARNEAAAITACLQSLLAQDYPGKFWEILLIDDHSHDSTTALAQELAEKAQPGRLKIIRLTGTVGNSQKKAALMAGVAAAEGEIILTTDADCTAPTGWAKTMAAAFTNPKVQLAVGPIRKTTAIPFFFTTMQALESAGMVALGAGAIGMDRPTFANGANLAFRKSAFNAVEGYMGIDSVASGDDELLLHKVAVHYPRSIRFVKNRDAIVDTPALTEGTAFRQQRIRWVSKARAYRNLPMTLAQMNTYLAMVCIVVVAVLSCFSRTAFGELLILLGVKTLADGLVLWPATGFLGQRRLIGWLFPAQLPHIMYILWVGLAGTFAVKYEWKGRKVK